MTHVCCPSCRLRFASADAAYLVVCPECGDPLEPALSSESAVGFRLYGPADPFRELPLAIALTRPVPPPV